MDTSVDNPGKMKEVSRIPGHLRRFQSGMSLEHVRLVVLRLGVIAFEAGLAG